MRVEVRSVSIMRLIPENDADRAVLAYWSAVAFKNNRITIMSTSSVDDRQDDMVIGVAGGESCP